MYDFVDEPIQRVNAGAADESAVEAVSMEDASVDIAAETRHTGEFSFELHGVSHPDALYRAAGGEPISNSDVLFGCPCCGRRVGRVIRVQATPESHWMAVCAMCAASVLDRYPEALIGGVVRSGRRRRRRYSEQRGPMRDAG
jgi:hypothetical protein